MLIVININNINNDDMFNHLFQLIYKYQNIINLLLELKYQNF